MLTLIIQSYLNVIAPLAIICSLIFFVGLYLIFRSRPAKKNASKTVFAETPVIDFDAIAGDDVITTQLDLARALIEAGRSESAKSILQTIVSQGSQTQQAQVAKTLLGTI